MSLLVASPVAAETRHFVFFGRDRHRIQETGFLETTAFAGAQLTYTWRELEPSRGTYDLSEIEKDLEFLQQHGKKIFIQLQDVSFSPEIVNVPAYLREDAAFGHGVAQQYSIEGDDDATATPEGWVARRWDPRVRERFVLLLQARTPTRSAPASADPTCCVPQGSAQSQLSIDCGA